MVLFCFWAGCCTVAEVRKRGADFWGEFEFYLSDMVVGIFLDVVLVTLLAPVAIAGKYPKFVKYRGIDGHEKSRYTMFILAE